MSRFVRPSKYRHTYGNRSKVNYENAKISGSAWDTDLVTAGGKYIAVNWQVSGGGAFAVLPSFSPFEVPQPEGFPTKLPDLMPLARGHTAPVLDTAWSPFDDNLVVSGGEDGKIFVWKIDDGMFNGWGEDDWEPEDLEPVGRLNAGGRKVGHVQFHPVASNVLASASGDHQLRLWDIESPDSPNIILTGHKDSIQSMCWNPIGTLLATTCCDRKLRLFDPRAGTEAVRITDGHGGIKGSRVVWLGDRDRIATTGFSKMSDRQLSLWDTAGLTNLDTQSLDSSAGIIIPFFAEGNDVLFLAGKGDGNIRYYEFEGDQFHFLNEYKSSDPQRGIGFIPRRGLDVAHNEIARAFKLSGGGIDPLSFVVPRKAEGFQSDIYPPANSVEPALSASDWFGGKTARPNLVDLETRATSANKTPIGTPSKTSSAPSPAPGAAAKKEEPKKEEAKKEEPKKDEVKKEEPKKEEVKKEEPKREESKPAAKREDSKPVSRDEPQQSARSLEKDVSESDSEPSSPKIPVPTGLVSGVAAAYESASKPSTPVNGSDDKKDSRASPKAADSKATETKSTESKAAEPQPTQNELLVKLLTPNAKVPTRGSPLSAGYDLYAAEDLTLPARGKGIVSAGISIAIPDETYGRIAPRSGLAAKHGIDVGAGVVDCDYRGEVKVVLFNHNDDEFKISQGDRIAQLILERIAMAPIRQVSDLDVTQRGAGGFGSTGRA